MNGQHTSSNYEQKSATDQDSVFVGICSLFEVKVLFYE